MRLSPRAPAAQLGRDDARPWAAPRDARRHARARDRNFYSFKLWNEARATGADLLWRTKLNHVLPVVERLGDGSYLSVLHEVVNNHRRRSDVVVRVVEYGLDDPGRNNAEERYRLITTITDPARALRASSPRSTPSAGSSRRRSAS